MKVVMHLPPPDHRVVALDDVAAATGRRERAGEQRPRGEGSLGCGLPAARARGHGCDQDANMRTQRIGKSPLGLAMSEGIPSQRAVRMQRSRACDAGALMR